MGIEQFLTSDQEILTVDGMYRIVRTTYGGQKNKLGTIVAIKYGRQDVCSANDTEVCIAEALTSSFVIPRSLVEEMLKLTRVPFVRELSQALLENCRAVDARLPPSPWEADIDDPETEPEFTGKFYHPPDGSSLPLYELAPAAAKDLATMRNLFHQLLEAVGGKP
jgi:hypothetical protein